jgi:putative DNA primase/helicase
VYKRQLLNAGLEDEGNAQAVAILHGSDFLHVNAYGWMQWTGTHWEQGDAEKALDRAVIGTLKERRIAAVRAEKEAIVKTAKPSAYRVRGCKTLLASILTDSVDHFDANPDLLNVENGVLDLRTGELVPHEPGQRFSYCCPVAFDPDADQSEWLAWLEDALPDPSTREYLQEAIGYSLTGHTREEVLFYVHGPARAGKGTLFETLLELLGHRPLADEVDFETFTADRGGDTQNFDLAGLKPCRFIAASESKKYGTLNAAKIKALTGGNEIRCAHKYGDFFSYRPQFKIWLSSNHEANADVDDDAAWGRLRVIHLPNSYLGHEDKTLKARLRQPDALAGVLAWAVEGARRWYAHGAQGLFTPDSVNIATQAARDAIDFVGQWLDECIEITGNPGDFAPHAAVYQSYKDWCESNGVKPKGTFHLGKALSKKGLDSTRKTITLPAGQRKQARGFEGVKLGV